MAYCPDCGNQISASQKFCRECGTDVAELGNYSAGTTVQSVDDLVAGADGEIKTKTLTKQSGMIRTYLYDQPLIEYLRTGEQPEHVLTHDTKGFRITHPDGTETTPDHGTDNTKRFVLITDQRILYVVGSESGDKTREFAYGDVVNATHESGLASGKLTFELVDGSNYTFATATYADEVGDAAAYVTRQMSGVETKTGNKSSDTANTGPPSSKIKNNHIPDERGNYVTAERVNKITDVLDTDEKVHYLTRGTTVDVEGSSAGHSLFGDDRSRKSGTRGYVRAGITDRRVVIKVPQWLGSDERSVPYDSVTSVDLDTGLTMKRLSLQTAGQTYHIEAHEPDKDECRQITRFIRNKISEANQQQVINQETSEADPTEQLKNLKELHERGVLTDEEFESKKQSLLDKL